MNNFSSMLYVADVVDEISIFLSTACLFLIFASVIGTIITFIIAGNYTDNQTTIDWMLKNNKRALFIGAALGFIATFFPSKQTIYMIAASEIGETTLNTAEGQKLRALLNETLDSMSSKKSCK